MLDLTGWKAEGTCLAFDEIRCRVTSSQAACPRKKNPLEPAVLTGDCIGYHYFSPFPVSAFYTLYLLPHSVVPLVFFFFCLCIASHSLIMPCAQPANKIVYYYHIFDIYISQFICKDVLLFPSDRI